MLDIQPTMSNDREKSNQSGDNIVKPAGFNNGINPESGAIRQNNDKKDTLLESSNEYDFLESKEDNSKLLFIFTLAVMIVVIVSWVYLYFAKVQNQSQLAMLDTQFDELEKQLSTPGLVKIEEISTRFSGGISTLSQLVNNQYYYSKLFDELDKRIPENAIVQNVSVDENNNMIFTANTSNLDDSSFLIKSLIGSKMFSNIFLNSDSSSQNTENLFYTVSLNMVLNQNMLKEKTTEVTQ